MSLWVNLEFSSRKYPENTQVSNLFMAKESAKLRSSGNWRSSRVGLSDGKAMKNIWLSWGKTVTATHGQTLTPRLFGEMPMTFEQIGNTLKNNALSVIEPVLDRFRKIASSEDFQKLANGIVSAFAIAATAVSVVIGLVSKVGEEVVMLLLGNVKPRAAGR